MCVHASHGAHVEVNPLELLLSYLRVVLGIEFRLSGLHGSAYLSSPLIGPELCSKSLFILCVYHYTLQLHSKSIFILCVDIALIWTSLWRSHKLVPNIFLNFALP